MKLRKHWQQWVPFYGAYYTLLKIPLKDFYEYSWAHTAPFLGPFWQSFAAPLILILISYFLLS